MNLHWGDQVVLLAYLVVVFVIGIVCARLIKTQKDLFLGGRRFGKVLLTFQTFGIGTHSEQVVAVVGQCYRLGLAGIWWQFMWLFATPFYWLSFPLLRRMRVMTTADYWAERFSPGLGVFSALVGVFQMTFPIATMLKGVSTVLEAVTDQAVDERVVVPVCAVLFVFYGIAGGLYAATITDLVQGILTIVLSLLLIPFILAKTGGMAGLHAMLDPSKFSFTVPVEMTVFYIAMLSLNGLVGVYTGPHTMTNAGSGRNEWDVRVGTMSGTLLKRFCTVSWAFMGLGALALYPGLDHHEEAFGHLVRDLLPPGLTGLMIAAVLAAVMSTCDALMLTGAALFTRNLYGSAVKNRSEAHYIWVGRFASVGIVLLASVLAFKLESVLEGLMWIWTLYAFMGLAWWAGIIWRRATAAAAWVSTLVTCAVYLGTWAYNQWNTDSSTDISYPVQIALYLSTGCIALILTSIYTSHHDPARVARFYRKMRTPVEVSPAFEGED
jgi:Na+/proline symporter